MLAGETLPVRLITNLLCYSREEIEIYYVLIVEDARKKKYEQIILIKPLWTVTGMSLVN